MGVPAARGDRPHHREWSRPTGDVDQRQRRACAEHEPRTDGAHDGSVLRVLVARYRFEDGKVCSEQDTPEVTLADELERVPGTCPALRRLDRSREEQPARPRPTTNGGAGLWGAVRRSDTNASQAALAKNSRRAGGPARRR